MFEACRRRRGVWVGLLLLAAGALVSAGAQASLLGATLNMHADPPRAPADGRTPVAISIEVLDGSGRPAPDGTPVNLVTTLGTIISPVETLGGLAQTMLTPSNQAGTAVVSAMVGGARALLEIEFTAVPGSASPGSRMVELTAEELAYNPEGRMFVAGPKAWLDHEAVTITADGLRYDVTSNVVSAQGNVVLKSGREELRAEALRFDLFTLRGRLIRVSGEQVERLLVEGERLQTRPDTSTEMALWARPMETTLRTWVKARSAIVDPNKKVILDHAAVYVDDLRVMGLRRHVMDPRQGSSLFGNTFGFSSLLGANMDIPVYYRASGNQIGALHITRNRAVGGVGADPGWSLGLREEYFREGKSEGALSIQDITQPTRGADWRHQIKLGAGSALTLDASLANFDEDAPTLKSGGLTYLKPMGAGRLSLAMSASDFGNSEYYYGSLSYRFRTSRLGSGVLMTPSLRMRHTRRFSETEEVIIDPDTGEVLEIPQENSGQTTSPGLDIAFNLPSREIKPNLMLNGMLLTGYAWGLEDGARGLFDAQFGVTRRLGPTDYVKLSYYYSSAPVALQASPFRIGRQRLSLNGRTKLREFDVTFNASAEIGGDRFFGYVGVMRPLPFGKDANGQPLWKIQASHIFSQLADYGLSSSRLSLTRKLGQYELALCYSPQGNGGFASKPWINLGGYGYTYSGGSHLWFELSSYGF